jgi:hypothetical protein
MSSRRNIKHLNQIMMMNNKFKFLIIVILSLFILPACKPEKIQIEVYTSDIKSVNEGEVLEVPLKIEFSMIGEDKDNELSKATDLAKKYLPEDSEFEITKGTFGKVMTIVTTIPMGTKKSLPNYIKENPRPLMLKISENKIILESTGSLKTLNSELKDINFMLSADLPAKSTIFRITSDSKKKVTVLATAVFSEKKPYLHFEKSIKRRKSVEVEFKGGDGSVYTEIPVQLELKF